MRNQTASLHASAPSSDDARTELARILSSPEFILSDRGRRFLQFIVNETLEGRAAYLKAFTIAQEVFGRDASFDAQNDPCVRIAARQLRSAVERYYLTAGVQDSVLIEIPTGGYVPTMRWRNCSDIERAQAQAQSTSGEMTTASEQEPIEPQKRERPSIRWIVASAVFVALAVVVMASLAEWHHRASIAPVASKDQPKIIVDRFQNAGESGVLEEVLSGLTDDIVVNLAKVKKITVIERGDAAEASEAEASYRLQGTVRLEGNDLRSIARLVRHVDGVVVWSGDYNVDIEGRSMLDVEAEIAGSIATAVAAPFEDDHKLPSEGR